MVIWVQTGAARGLWQKITSQIIISSRGRVGSYVWSQAGGGRRGGRRRAAVRAITSLSFGTPSAAVILDTETKYKTHAYVLHGSRHA